jgi:hypothetical protein
MRERSQCACDARVQLRSPPDKFGAADLAGEEEAIRNPLVTARHARPRSLSDASACTHTRQRAGGLVLEHRKGIWSAEVDVAAVDDFEHAVTARTQQLFAP